MRLKLDWKWTENCGLKRSSRFWIRLNFGLKMKWTELDWKIQTKNFNFELSVRIQSSIQSSIQSLPDFNFFVIQEYSKFKLLFETWLKTDWMWTESGLKVDWMWTECGLNNNFVGLNWTEWVWSGLKMDWKWTESGLNVDWKWTQNGLKVDWI